MNSPRAPRWLIIITPGILVAATGVGAGDLLTASLAGAKLGVMVFWAVIFGTLMKWGLNEGLARWQLATGTTLLQGWTHRLRIHWLFLAYLVPFSFTVGLALIKACGLAGHVWLPLHSDPRTSTTIWGVIHSLLGVVMVYLGGFKLFERFMSVCIAVMFLTVTYCAVRIVPTIDWTAVEFVSPFTLGRAGFEKELTWTIGLIGGVGGTVTLLAYGYWIREQKRAGPEAINTCRIDLAVAYTLTALFGVAMLVIASTTPELDRKSLDVVPLLAEHVGRVVGTPAKYLFLLGFWGAVFSSLLGVWQAVPYLFADVIAQLRRRDPSAAENPNYAGTWPYRIFLLYLAFAPLTALGHDLAVIQLTYAVLGALFLPPLALTLLIMNNHPRWMPREHRNGWLTNGLLTLTLAFFIWQGFLKIVGT